MMIENPFLLKKIYPRKWLQKCTKNLNCSHKNAIFLGRYRVNYKQRVTNKALVETLKVKGEAIVMALYSCMEWDKKELQMRYTKQKVKGTIK